MFVSWKLKPMPARRTAQVAITILFALTLFASGSAISPAQENSPSVTFNLFSVEGLVVGDTYSIDAAFGEQHGVSVPAPFRFLVPREDGVTPLFQAPNGSDGMLIKVNFATEDRQLIENMRFVTMTLPLGDGADRLTVLARLLANDGFNQAVATYPENEYIGAREIKIGDYDAVEVVGKYIEPQLGLMYLRLVGIPNPGGAASIYAVINVVASRVELQSIDDLARTRSGTALRFFEYLAE
jgi:hypothetical protein